MTNGPLVRTSKSSPQSAPTPKEIADRVGARWDFSGMVALRVRMERDFSYYRLNKHVVAEGYRAFTSNRPKTIGDKIISWLSEARMVVSASRVVSDTEMRLGGTMLEKFARGSFRMADDRLRATLQPSLQDWMAFTICLRGWYAGRSMMNKLDNVAFIEIDPWDPLRVVWDQDARGVTWMARKQSRSLEQLKNLYGYRREAGDGPYTEEDENGIDTIEYMDRNVYGVVAEDKWIVRGQRHNVRNDRGQPIVPGYLGFQGPVPILQPVTSADITWADVGESVMSAIRNHIEIQNQSMSDWMTLVRRAVKHPLVIGSPDGKKRLVDDPYREGANIYLKAGETMELAPEMKLLADAAAFMGVVHGEVQQGTLADVHFGDIKFQLSGTAANILRAGAAHQVMHRLSAMGDSYRQIANILRWQYQTGGYGKIDFAGNAGILRRWFDEEIDFRDLEKAGYLSFAFKNTLGFEDPQRFTTAQMLREAGETGVPLAPDEWIWSEMMDVEDAEAWGHQINAQIARRKEPKSMALNMLEGLLATGRDVEAQFIWEQLKKMGLAEKREEALAALEFQRTMLQALGVVGPDGMVTSGALGPGADDGSSNGAAGADNPALHVDNAMISGSALGLDQFRESPPDNTGSRAPGQPRNRRQQMAEEEARASKVGIEIARR